MLSIDEQFTPVGPTYIEETNTLPQVKIQLNAFF